MTILTNENIALHDKINPYRTTFQRGGAKLAQALSCIDQAISMMEANDSLTDEDKAFVINAINTEITDAVAKLEAKRIV